MYKSTPPVVVRLAAAPLGLVIAATTLAGCGSSSAPAHSAPSSAASSASSAGSSSTTVSPSASGSATSAPAYQPLTKAQLTALLPGKPTAAGWKATPSTDSSDDADAKARDAELAACTGEPSTDKDQVAEASTPDFTLETNAVVQTISATADSYRTVADVTADAQLFKNPKLESCYQKQFAKYGPTLVGSGFTYVSSTVKVTPGTTTALPGRIDAVLQLKKAGQPVTVGVTEVALVGRGVEESLTFFAVGQPVSAAVAQPFVTEAAAKLAKGTSTTDA